MVEASLTKSALGNIYFSFDEYKKIKNCGAYVENYYTSLMSTEKLKRKLSPHQYLHSLRKTRNYAPVIVLHTESELKLPWGLSDKYD